MSTKVPTFTSQTMTHINTYPKAQQMAQDSENVERRKRSQELTPEQRRAFKKYAKKNKVMRDLAEKLEVHPNTITRLKKEWSCSPDTYTALIENKIIPAA